MLASVLLIAAAVLAGADNPDSSTTWRGLVVADEVECMDYVSANFQHSPSVEQKIADNLGGWWSPYDGTAFPNEESDIEHIKTNAELRISCGNAERGVMRSERRCCAIRSPFRPPRGR